MISSHVISCLQLLLILSSIYSHVYIWGSPTPISFIVSHFPPASPHAWPWIITRSPVSARGCKWRLWTFLLRVCQPQGLFLRGILSAQVNRSTPFVIFSTIPYSRVFLARLHCRTIMDIMAWSDCRNRDKKTDHVHSNFALNLLPPHPFFCVSAQARKKKHHKAPLHYTQVTVEG